MRKRGYSLVEVLVATLLMAVVMGTAIVVMNSTRRVTDQVAFEHAEEAPLKSWEQFSILLRRDLDHVQETLDEDGTSFQLEAGVAEWLSINRTPEGRQPQLIRYQFDEKEEWIERCVAPLHRSAVQVWSTNVVLEQVDQLTMNVSDGTTWKEEWLANAKEGELPRLLRVRVERKGEAQVIDALLPTALRYEGL